MFDRITGAGHAGHPGNVLKMVQNPRMAGSVPAWVRADSAEDNIARGMAEATTGARPRVNNALSLRMENPAAKKDEEFTFFDLLDMVNPLQHIPIVNLAYRKLTGDEIKPVSMVVGGAIFGGPVGAGAGIVNAIAQEETGRDLAGNALALAQGEKIHWKKHLPDNPEMRLAAVLDAKPKDELPVSLLAFTDTRSGWRAPKEKEDPPVNFSPYEIY